MLPPTSGTVDSSSKLVKPRSITQNDLLSLPIRIEYDFGGIGAFTKCRKMIRPCGRHDERKEKQRKYGFHLLANV